MKSVDSLPEKKRERKLVPWVFWTPVEPPGQGGFLSFLLALVAEILFHAIQESRPLLGLQTEAFSLGFLEDSFSSGLRAAQEGWGGAEAINIPSFPD